MDDNQTQYNLAGNTHVITILPGGSEETVHCKSSEFGDQLFSLTARETASCFRVSVATVRMLIKAANEMEEA